ncbi:MAG: hypothetical protein RLZZ292_1631 [Bacteroidota bacterium]|jgi:hypothetical protein
MRLPLRSILLSLCFFLPATIAHTCGLLDTQYHGYSFFNGAVANPLAIANPLFLDFSKIYNATKDSTRQAQITEENIWEWQQKFCSYSKLEDVRYLIYKAPMRELEQLYNLAKSKSSVEAEEAGENVFAQQLVVNRCTETIEYLIFAKRCEPYCVAQDAWNGPVENVLAMRQLVTDGLNTFKKIESPFIKLRYAYQCIRLAHYSKNYQLVLDLYDFCTPKIDKRVKSIVNYWVLAHKAGALQSLGQRAEAAYLFSIVFDRCKSKREAAYRSFSILTDDEFIQCLTLCKNDHEKCTLYAMRGAAEHSKSVEEMIEIYKIDPKNDYLEVLLLREVKKLEHDLLGYSFNDKKEHNRRLFNLPSKESADYAIRVNDFVRYAARQGRVANVALWQVADGYLELIRGDGYAALATLEVAEANTKSEPLLQQIEILKTTATITAWQQLNDDTENAAWEITKSDLYSKNRDLPDFLFDKLTTLYENSGQPGAAFRCHYHLSALKPNPKLEILDDLLRLCKKGGKTNLARFLASDSKGETLESELWEIKGTLLLANHQNEAALECFKKVSVEVLEKSKFNPFIPRIKDCINCPIADSLPKYNRKEIAERLLDLEYRAKAGLQEGAEHYYALGVAYYNMTYFGYAWKTTDYFRCSDLKNDGASRWLYPYGNKENKDCTAALATFAKAYQLAKIQNRELAARCAFWITKCIQSQYVGSKNYETPSGGQIPRLPPAFYAYFNILKREYKDTKYYNQVIKECKYFEWYANI